MVVSLEITIDLWYCIPGILPSRPQKFFTHVEKYRRLVFIRDEIYSVVYTIILLVG